MECNPKATSERHPGAFRQLLVGPGVARRTGMFITYEVQQRAYQVQEWAGGHWPRPPVVDQICKCDFDSVEAANAG